VKAQRGTTKSVQTTRERSGYGSTTLTETHTGEETRRKGVDRAETLASLVDFMLR
jgi:hypothetical protein